MTMTDLPSGITEFDDFVHTIYLYYLKEHVDIEVYIIIRVHSAFSLVASCVLLKYTRTDDVN